VGLTQLRQVAQSLVEVGVCCQLVLVLGQVGVELWISLELWKNQVEHGQFVLLLTFKLLKCSQNAARGPT